MIRTITIGSCTTVQGLFLRELEDGRIEIRVGAQVYAGWPVGSVRPAVPALA